MSKYPTLLIDGDQYLYKAAAANEVEVNWGDDLWTLHSELGEAKVMFDDAIASLKAELQTPNILICLSDDRNFRKEIYPEYKSKRKLTRKPVAYHALKCWVQEEYPWLIYPRCEADDVMGIVASKPKANCIIVSDDKDMQTIPSKLYRKGEVVTVSEHEADLYFFKQTLTGDVTDGYPGCPGIGDKSADKLLAKAVEQGTPWADAKQLNEIIWKAIVEAYQKQELDENYCLTQARCARILRYTDFDLDKKEIKLWTP
jgi:DNA polymerase-1